MTREEQSAALRRWYARQIAAGRIHLTPGMCSTLNRAGRAR
jgi:hypothetical protein